MALFLIVVQAHFIMNNVLEGMIWFFLPAALVITNDIFAYVCGITFGRTQLIKLSPKKTVEGFVGAWVMTVLFGILLTNLLLRSKYFICPATDLGANIFTGLECEPNPVFIPRTYSTPQLFFLPPGYTLSVTMAPMQIHTFFWASFASLIAPFGGFFASGLKRTFKIKDFGDSIPGHGGMTDRMDCQFIMGLFAFIYYHTFIAIKRTSPSDVMELAIMGLSADEQLEVVRGLLKYLSNQGIVGPAVCVDVIPRLVRTTDTHIGTGRLRQAPVNEQGVAELDNRRCNEGWHSPGVRYDQADSRFCVFAVRCSAPPRRKQRCDGAMYPSLYTFDEFLCLACCSYVTIDADKLHSQKQTMLSLGAGCSIARWDWSTDNQRLAAPCNWVGIGACRIPKLYAKQGLLRR